MNTSAQTHQELAQLRRRVQIFYTAHTVLYAAALGLLVWRPARMAGLCWVWPTWCSISSGSAAR